MTTTKQCAQCQGWYPLVFFRPNGRARLHAPSARRSVCRGCEQTARDARKRTTAGRLAVKMAETRRHVARRLGVPVAVLEQQYGWTLAQMEHDATPRYAAGCPVCGRAFAHTGDLTLLVVHQAAPHYPSAVRWACRACNAVGIILRNSS